MVVVLGFERTREGNVMSFEPKVPFTRPNAKSCICWLCPVQRDSACTRENASAMGDAMTARVFTAEVMPGLYCSSGLAVCQDIDVTKSCICRGCDVHKQFQLSDGQPTDHYCERGAAR